MVYNMTREKTADIRARLLASLRECGGWLSGEELSGMLGMSRAAVAKHIAALRAAGHAIEAVTRRGYRLTAEAEPFACEMVREGLKTKVIGQGLWHWSAQSASTNRQAVKLALEDAPEGSVVLAAQQDAGRGRKGRRWASPLGGVYISLILRPRLAPQCAPLITLMTAVAVAETVRILSGCEAVVKWPNDVLVHNRKISGNLTELGLVADSMEWAVSGAGINVNTRLSDMPESVAARATSLFMETGRVVPRHQVARVFLERADAWYMSLRAGEPGPVIERWKALSNCIGRSICLDVSGTRIEGVARDIDQEGRLRLVDKDGREHCLYAGDEMEP